VCGWVPSAGQVSLSVSVGWGDTTFHATAGSLSLIAGGGRRGARGGRGREYGDVKALILTPSGSYADARRLVCKVAAEAAKAAGFPTGV